MFTVTWKRAEELISKYREALLQKAFRGELVPQDPNDEPASKLLERIRADRAKQNDGKKRKKDDLPPIKPEEIPFEIPKSWEWVRFGDVISIDAQLVDPKDYLDSPHIAPNHIESQTGRLLNYTTVRKDDPIGRGFEYVPFSDRDLYGPILELWGS